MSFAVCLSMAKYAFSSDDAETGEGELGSLCTGNVLLLALCAELSQENDRALV